MPDDFEWPTPHEVQRQRAGLPPEAPTKAPPAASAPPAPPAPPTPAPNQVDFRPSLWAAIDAPAKVIGAGFLFLAPFYLGAVLAGETFRPLALLAGLGSINLLYALLVPLAPAVQLIFTTYRVDEDGIRIHTQILSKTERRVSWEKVTALRHRRTILDRLCGIERVDVIAYGMRGATLQLVGLRNAPWLRNLVAAKMRQNATVESLFRSD